jgi:hypothetical protein
MESRFRGNDNTASAPLELAATPFGIRFLADKLIALSRDSGAHDPMASGPARTREKRPSEAMPPEGRGEQFSRIPSTYRSRDRLRRPCSRARQMMMARFFSTRGPLAPTPPDAPPGGIASAFHFGPHGPLSCPCAPELRGARSSGIPTRLNRKHRGQETFNTSGEFLTGPRHEQRRQERPFASSDDH